MHQWLFILFFKNARTFFEPFTSFSSRKTRKKMRTHLYSNPTSITRSTRPSVLLLVPFLVLLFTTWYADAAMDTFRIAHIMPLLRQNGARTNFMHMRNLAHYLFNVAAKNDTLAAQWGFTPQERALLPNITMEINFMDSKESMRETTMHMFRAADYCNQSTSVDLVNGLWLDDAAVAAATVAPLFDMPVIAHGSTVTSLGDKDRYPTFSRIYPANANQVPLMTNLAVEFNWRRVGVVATDDEYGSTMTLDFAKACAVRNITILQAQTVFSRGSKEEMQKSMRNALDLLRLSGVRIIFVFALVQTSLQDFILDPARDVGMDSAPYVYIGAGGVCTITTRPIVTPGFLCLYPEIDATLPAFRSFYGRTLRWMTAQNVTSINVGELITVYDSFFFAAQAITNWVRLADENGWERHGNAARLKFIQVIRNTTWSGATGLIKLNEKGERAYPYLLLNRPFNDTLAQVRPLHIDLVPVAKLPITSEFARPIISREIVFPGGSTEIPLDRALITLYEKDVYQTAVVSYTVVVLSVALAIVSAWVTLLLVDSALAVKLRLWRVGIAALPLSIGSVMTTAFCLSSISYNWMPTGFLPLQTFLPIVFLLPCLAACLYAALKTADPPQTFRHYYRAAEETSDLSKTSNNSSKLREEIKDNGIDIAPKTDDRPTELKTNTCKSILKQMKKLSPCILGSAAAFFCVCGACLLAETGVYVEEAINVSTRYGWGGSRLVWIASAILFQVAFVLYARWRVTRWRITSSIVLGLAIWLAGFGSTLSVTILSTATRQTDDFLIDKEYDRVADGVKSASPVMTSLNVQIAATVVSVCCCIALLMLNVAQLRWSNDALDVLLGDKHKQYLTTLRERDMAIARGNDLQRMIEAMIVCRNNKDHSARSSLWTLYNRRDDLYKPIFPFTAVQTEDRDEEPCPGLVPSNKSAARYSDLSLEDVLDNALGIELLSDWMASRNVSENLFFLIDVAVFERRVPIEYRQDAARIIYNTYIKNDAVHQVNISATMAAAILKEIEADGQSQKLFEKAVIEVRKLVDENDLKPFLDKRRPVDSTSTAYAIKSWRQLYNTSLSKQLNKDNFITSMSTIKSAADRSQVRSTVSATQPSSPGGSVISPRSTASATRASTSVTNVQTLPLQPNAPLVNNLTAASSSTTTIVTDA